MSSKVISKEQLSAYQRWELPTVDGQVGNQPLMTAKQLELIGKQAHDEGFAQGRQQGYASGEAQLQERVAALDRLLASVNEALKELDHELEQELMQLAVAIARQIVRREIKLDPGGIVTVAREAANQLSLGNRNITIQANPQDAALLREHLKLSETESTWRVVDDPSLLRGDCRIHGEGSRIDATVEARLAAVAVAALGGERKEDEAGG